MQRLLIVPLGRKKGSANLQQIDAQETTLLYSITLLQSNPDCWETALASYVGRSPVQVLGVNGRSSVLHERAQLYNNEATLCFPFFGGVLQLRKT